MNLTYLLITVHLIAVGTFTVFILYVFIPKIIKGSNIKTMFLSDKNALISTLTFAIIYSFLFSQLFIFNKKFTPYPIYFLGFVIASFGLIIAIIARIQLHEFWSPVSKTEISKKIISNGLFSFSRHPIYLGRLLFLIGVMLMLNIYGLIISLPYWIALRRKAFTEEKLLSKYNSSYIEYMKKVKRLI